MQQTPTFLGTGWDFPPAFDKTRNSVAMVSDEQDINSSLQVLLSTAIGERIMQPEYGCDLRDFLFEPLDTALRAYIKDLILNAILYNEPRIELNEVSLITKNEEGILEIALEYTIRMTNSRYNFVFPFYLEEGTNIER
ncbi:MAG: GPW/gp25 family protein [Deferribacteres bacterium]|nr:GPW/gp25 family protein [candidate division KSB1 bacterium]MCB9500640.1 GPW/gp25 family protein [Deferribacteres bacterium]